MDIVTYGVLKKYVDSHGGGAGLDVKVVDQLPETGKALTIYFIHSEDKEAPDYFNEWMWIQNAWEMIGTTQVDLNDYVKFTDYATNNKGGVIVASPNFGFQLENGIPNSTAVSLEVYKTKALRYFISKGTLENIKSQYVKEGMAANMSYDEETETLTITTE